jgi:ketosteroid isomerase-like protein
MKNLTLLIISIILYSCTYKPDIEEIKKELINVDLEFSKLSIEKGKNYAFSYYIHNDGVLLRPDGMPLQGKAALDSLQLNRADTAYTLKWKPMYANASQSGELGYTYGVWLLTTADTSMMGTYATVWKKDEQAKWKFILDMGNDGLGEDEDKQRINF